MVVFIKTHIINVRSVYKGKTNSAAREAQIEHFTIF
jgi:hypothetical protein